RRSTERQVRLFPDPDSPTNPNVSPACKTKLTFATARPTPRLLNRWVCSPRTSRIGETLGASSISDIPQLGVEYVAHPITHEVIRKHNEENGQAGHRGDPPGRFDVIEAFGNHAAPSRRRGRNPRPEEGQRSLDDNCPSHLQGAQHHQCIGD